MPLNHVVKEGECISSISFLYGFFPDVTWNDPANSKLKNKRKNPNVLFPGDIVAIPDKRPKEVSCKAQGVLKFKMKGVPAKLRMRFTKDDKPRTSENYKLKYAGKEISGQTNAEGIIEAWIPPDIQSGILEIGDGKDTKTYYLNFGKLEPVDTVKGAQTRLRNLGFYDSEISDRINDKFTEAIKNFQIYFGHPDPSGQLDNKTAEELVRLHDSRKK